MKNTSSTIYCARLTSPYGTLIPTPISSGQLRQLGAHFGGHLDGVLRGLAGEVVEALVSEQKTHNDRSFKDVRAKGVENSKPEHHAQMQVYMHLMSLSFAPYQAVNKNDDDLYFEIVEYDAAFAERLLAKAEKIITSDFPLTRISDDPAFLRNANSAIRLTCVSTRRASKLIVVPVDGRRQGSTVTHDGHVASTTATCR